MESTDSPKSSPRAERVALGSARSAMIRSNSSSQIQSMRARSLSEQNVSELAAVLEELRCTVAAAAKRPNPINKKFLTDLVERIDKVDGFVSARSALQDAATCKKLITFAAEEKQVFLSFSFSFLLNCEYRGREIW